MKSHDTTEYQPRCPICDYSGKKVAAHINEEHFRGSGGKRDKTEVDADNNEEFPSLALESGEESEQPNNAAAAKQTASRFQLAAKKASSLSEWRCSIWEGFNRTLIFYETGFKFYLQDGAGAWWSNTWVLQAWICVCHFAQLPSQFCQICICPSRI